MGRDRTQLHLSRLFRQLRHNICVCKHSLLFVSLFKPEVRMPDSWITPTPSLRKKCKSIKGTAGRRRLRLIEERQCDEKSIDSKVTFLKGL